MNRVGVDFVDAKSKTTSLAQAHYVKIMPHKEPNAVLCKLTSKKGSRHEYMVYGRFGEKIVCFVGNYYELDRELTIFQRIEMDPMSQRLYDVLVNECSRVTPEALQNAKDLFQKAYQREQVVCVMDNKLKTNPLKFVFFFALVMFFFFYEFEVYLPEGIAINYGLARLCTTVLVYVWHFACLAYNMGELPAITVYLDVVNVYLATDIYVSIIFNATDWFVCYIADYKNDVPIRNLFVWLKYFMELTFAYEIYYA
jgi:hypothetical protein